MLYLFILLHKTRRMVILRTTFVHAASRIARHYADTLCIVRLSLPSRSNLLFSSVLLRESQMYRRDMCPCPLSALLQLHMTPLSKITYGPPDNFGGRPSFVIRRKLDTLRCKCNHRRHGAQHRSCSRMRQSKGRRRVPSSQLQKRSALQRRHKRLEGKNAHMDDPSVLGE